MRDADLWDDFAVMIRQRSGRLGQLVLLFGELLAGPDMASVSSTQPFTQNGRNFQTEQQEAEVWDIEPTEQEQATVKRELTENW